MPDSDTAGRLGIRGDRCLLLMAIARTTLLLTCEDAARMSANMASVSPDATLIRAFAVAVYGTCCALISASTFNSSKPMWRDPPTPADEKVMGVVRAFAYSISSLVDRIGRLLLTIRMLG
jgi:hypothetical protein